MAKSIARLNLNFVIFGALPLPFTCRVFNQIEPPVIIKVLDCRHSHICKLVELGSFAAFENAGGSIQGFRCDIFISAAIGCLV